MDAVAAAAADGGGARGGPLLLNLSGRRLTAFDAAALAAAAAVPRPGSKGADTTAAASAVKDQQDRVQRLDLSCNFVHSFEAAHLAPFRHVTALYLGANELAAVPDLSALVHLQELHLNNNRLTAIPETLQRLPELRILDLRSNRIRSAAGLPPLPKLQRLSLSSNWVDDAGFSGDTVPDLPELAFLGLYGNRLTSAPALVAVLQQRCRGLRELVVADNAWPPGAPRSGVPVAGWSVLPALEWVDDAYVDRRPLAAAAEDGDGPDSGSGSASKRPRGDAASTEAH